MLEDKRVPLLSLSSLLTDSSRAVRKEFRKGADRLVAPAVTVEHLRPLLAQIGITRLANVTGLDFIGIPVAVACRPNSRSVAVSNGKGLDFAAAEASALMEAVEGFHAERIMLPLKLCSYNDLVSSHRLVDVEAVPRRTNSVYHPNLPLLWVEGHDLIHQEPIWLPYELVHTNYTVPLPQGSGCFVMSSNGLASGNHLLSRGEISPRIKCSSLLYLNRGLPGSAVYDLSTDRHDRFVLVPREADQWSIAREWAGNDHSLLSRRPAFDWI